MNRLLLLVEEYGPNSGLWAKTSLQEISICSAFYQRRWRAALQLQMLPSNWTVGGLPQSSLEGCLQGSGRRWSGRGWVEEPPFSRGPVLFPWWHLDNISRIATCGMCRLVRLVTTLRTRKWGLWELAGGRICIQPPKYNCKPLVISDHF